jgi:hypothetical protein
MAARGVTSTGSRVLLHLMAGSKEDAGTLGAFAGQSIHRIDACSGSFRDMRARGPGEPLLVVPDGAPGVIEAIETRFPRAARQRCLAHRMRNLAATVPEDLRLEVKARIQAACQATGRAIARDPARGVVADFAQGLPSATACFTDDPEACIAHLGMPVTRRPATGITNLPERSSLEERHRLGIIPNAFGGRPVRELMSGAMTRAAGRWRAIRLTGFERRRIAAVGQEPDEEYEAANGTRPAPQQPREFPAVRGLGHWSVSTTANAQFVLDAFDQAVHDRAPFANGVPAGHSGRGGRYLSIKYSERLADEKIEPSLGSVGDSFDNALAETVIVSFKTEVIRRPGPWRSVDGVEAATLERVDRVENHRLLERLGCATPAEAEARFRAAIAEPGMAA